MLGLAFLATIPSYNTESVDAILRKPLMIHEIVTKQCLKWGSHSCTPTLPQLTGHQIPGLSLTFKGHSQEPLPIFVSFEAILPKPSKNDENSPEDSKI